MPVITFNLNGNPVSVDADKDEELLWVLRDLLGVTGPKYGCGVGVCRACTCHVNGKAVAVCIAWTAVVAFAGLAVSAGLGKGGVAAAAAGF